MAEISIIELIVYGIVGYTGIIALVLSAFKEDTPTTKSLAVVRSIWIIAPIVCMGMLASGGALISFDTVQTVNTITDNATSTVVFTEDITVERSITLVNPVWVTLHGLFFTMLVIYFIWNMLQVFAKRE